MQSSQSGTARVRAYYERNTRLFLALGLGREARAIHRAVWDEGAASYAEALGYAGRRLRHEVERVAAARNGPVRVLDLGCGVGGALLDLARCAECELFGLGVSISRTQVRLAARYAAREGTAGRCGFVEADFARLPAAARFDVALAVESLVHASDPGHVLAQAAGALRPGGLLLVCDDFLEGGARGSDARWVAAFRRGWHAPGLSGLVAFLAAAERAGLRLVEQRDLTPLLRLAPPPEPFGAALLRLAELAPPSWLFTQSLAGSMALQRCLARGLVRYRWLTLERAG